MLPVRKGTAPRRGSGESRIIMVMLTGTVLIAPAMENNTRLTMRLSMSR
ncbi:hypothetical protein ACOM2C_02635 [Pseudarthrobacter sp. So.54]